MRVFTILSVIVTFLLAAYRWRYKLLNVLLAISSIQKIIIPFMMRIPLIRKKVVPSLFSNDLKA